MSPLSVLEDVTPGGLLLTDLSDKTSNEWPVCQQYQTNDKNYVIVKAKGSAYGVVVNRPTGVWVLRIKGKTPSKREFELLESLVGR